MIDDSDVTTRMKRLEEYRDLRARVEAMAPKVREDIRAVFAGGQKKAQIARLSGLSRVWIDRIINNER